MSIRFSRDQLIQLLQKNSRTYNQSRQSRTVRPFNTNSIHHIRRSLNHNQSPSTENSNSSSSSTDHSHNSKIPSTILPNSNRYRESSLSTSALITTSAIALALILIGNNSYLLNLSRASSVLKLEEVQDQEKEKSADRSRKVRESSSSIEKIYDELIKSYENGLFLWGSNRNRLILPESELENVKRPLPVPSLKGLVFKDLKLHEKYGAAVDQFGDLFVWGPEITRTEALVPVLKGYGIRQIACTSDKLYALSKKGQVYVLDVDRENFDRKSSNKSSGWLSWLSFGLGNRLTGQNDQVQSLKVDPSDRALDRNEKFVSIAAGDHHILALTSSGRTFATPASMRANDYGQLGVKNVKINNSSGSDLESIVMNPRAIDDFESSNKERVRQSRARINQQLKWLGTNNELDKSSEQSLSRSSNGSETDSGPAEDSKKNQLGTILHEIPELRSLKVTEISCGSSHSLVLTSSGEVYGFGANQFGQIGAGPQMIFPGLSTPTETKLTRSSGSSTKRCIEIAAGGDSSFFVVESLEPKKGSKTVEVYASGNGQFGCIGNGQWMNQPSPTKVKTISGLIEWSESEKRSVPINIHSISVGKNHVAVSLDNLTKLDGKEFGRDVLIWGQGSDYQIGNQKRANLSIPQHVSPLSPPSSSTSTVTVESSNSVTVGGLNDSFSSVKDEERDKGEDGQERPNKEGESSLLDSGTQSPMPYSRLQLQGKKKVGKVWAEQDLVTGWGITGVYWKVIE